MWCVQPLGFSCKKEGGSDPCYDKDKLEGIMWREISQSQNDQDCVIPHAHEVLT